MLLISFYVHEFPYHRNNVILFSSTVWQINHLQFLVLGYDLTFFHMKYFTICSETEIDVIQMLFGWAVNRHKPKYATNTLNIPISIR